MVHQEEELGAENKNSELKVDARRSELLMDRGSPKDDNKFVLIKLVGIDKRSSHSVWRHVDASGRRTTDRDHHEPAAEGPTPTVRSRSDKCVRNREVRRLGLVMVC